MAYTVQAGDNLSSIAQKNGTTLPALLQLNPQFQANPNMIQPGQNVMLPAAGAGTVNLNPAGGIAPGTTGAGNVGPTGTILPTDANGGIDINALLKQLGVNTGSLDLSTVGATTNTNTLTQPKSGFDIQGLYKQMTDMRQSYLDQLKPSGAELDLQNQLLDIQQRINQQQTSYEGGLAKSNDEVKPMEFITGDKASLETRNNLIQAGMQRDEANIVQRLGLAQSARQMLAEGYKTTSGYLSDDMGFALKMQETANTQAQQAIDNAFKYDQATRDKAAQVITFFKDSNIDPTKISDMQFTQLGASIGMDGNTLKTLLQSSHDTTTIDQKIKALQAGILPEQLKDMFSPGGGSAFGGTSSGSGTYSADQIANTIKQIESGGDYTKKGSSGEIGAYQFMPDTWTQYSQEYASANGLNQTLAPTQANQDTVAKFKIQQWLNQGKTPQQIALMWNGGEGAKQNKSGVNDYGAPYNTSTYVQNFNNNLPTLSPTQDATVQQEKNDLRARINRLPVGNQDNIYSGIASFQNANDIINLLNKHTFGTCPGSGIWQEWMAKPIGLTNSDYNEFSAASTAFTSNYIKSLSGVQVSDKERAQLVKALPSPFNTEQVNRDNLNTLMKTLKNKLALQLNINVDNYPHEIPQPGLDTTNAAKYDKK